MGDKTEQNMVEWYNSIARSYDELYANEQGLKHDMILKAIENKQFNIVIDVGCGSGSLLERVRETCDFSVGVDLSINMLKLAKARNDGQTDYILATNRLLPFVDGIADCLLSVSTMEQSTDLLEILSELNRIRTPIGLAIISLFHSKEGPPIQSSLSQLLKVSDRETMYFLERHG